MRRAARVLPGLGVAIVVVTILCSILFPGLRQGLGVFTYLLVGVAVVLTFLEKILNIVTKVSELRKTREEQKPAKHVGAADLGDRCVAAGGASHRPIAITGNGSVVISESEVAVKPSDAERVPSALYQLPAAIADFAGRESEVSELCYLLAEGEQEPAICAIAGMGGVGKSALAVQVAHQVTRAYPDGQIVVDMRGTSSQPLTPQQAMVQVISALYPDGQIPDTAIEVAAVYRSALTGKRVLILLDDAADTAQVRPLLPPSSCGLILTSRRRISLPGVRCHDLDGLSRVEARYFLEGIMRVSRATTGELDAISDLCGRLPLALRVAGDFLKSHLDWSAAEYVEALSDERERLARLKHEDLDVEASLGLSAAHLAGGQRDLARRWQALSVFPAPFARAAAAAVWQVEETVAREALSELTQLSLVHYEPGPRLYRLHDLMRLVAENVFGYEGSEPNDAADREHLDEAIVCHAAHYLERGRRAVDLYLEGGTQVVEGLGLFDSIWPHLKAAWIRMCEREREDSDRWLCNLPARMSHVLNVRLSASERIPILEASLSAAHRLADRRNEGIALGNMGDAFVALGEVHPATECCEQELEIARELGDRRGEGRALGRLGHAFAALGETRRPVAYFEMDRAVEYHDKAIEIVRDTGDRRGAAIECRKQALLYEQSDARRAANLQKVWVDYLCEIHDPDAETQAELLQDMVARLDRERKGKPPK